MNQQSIQANCSGSQSSEGQLKTDAACAGSLLDTADSGSTRKPVVKETTSTKSKAELRAERRALQVSKKIVAYYLVAASHSWMFKI